ncbi:hypothetical protein HN51_042047 [Arachis hypogaea]|uniref:PPPDE domain-containing protein n=1 Tax=Arachis hypogaea TaxID=3818 RepID=A0A444YV78_ARAHY|nr:deSI-like protein At4g17486 [Arachis hypogaea]QHN87898.1 DeSI-like protein [Arachis hypogaea]RYR05833.1 hypothetical protein Ahy_B06g085654 [Arachis hypogaea]
MLCTKLQSSQRKKKPGFPVYLNVYDLTPINGYAYWLGLGVYHSGVQVHGVEYGFGAHERDTTGIFEVEPRHCPGFTFRKSIFIGNTDMGPNDVRCLIEKLAQEFSGNTYHLIQKNCNHFCQDLSLKLTGRSIPRWINRLARIGFLCNCVLPPSLNDTRINPQEEKKKMRTQSCRFEPALSSPPSLSRGHRHSLTAPGSLVNDSPMATVKVK